MRVNIEVAEDDTRWLAEECIATSLHLLKWHGLKFDDEHSVLKVYFNRFEFLSIVYCQSLIRRILFVGFVFVLNFCFNIWQDRLAEAPSVLCLSSVVEDS